jgi:hypothetical protein
MDSSERTRRRRFDEDWVRLMILHYFLPVGYFLLLLDCFISERNSRSLPDTYLARIRGTTLAMSF